MVLVFCTRPAGVAVGY